MEQDAIKTSSAGSIRQVSQRLLLWAKRDGGGIARVEYASEFSRRELLQRLRGEGVMPIEIDLLASQTAAEVIEFLLERLADISINRGDSDGMFDVVSISGFAQAFQPQRSLADSLRTLNFNREALTAFPARQIWWMTPTLLDTSLHAMPDMHGWFNPQLSLTEVITQGAEKTAASPIETKRRSYSNIDDARQRSRRLLAELEDALESEASEVALISTYLIPALEAVAEVGARRELEALTMKYEALLNHFYSMNNDAVLTALGAGEASREKALSFARSLNKLVTVFYEQGLYAVAERLCVRALEIRKTELGDYHLDTADSLNNLAELYWSQGRYSEAEPLYLEALEIRKAELGNRHPDTASSLNNLAGLYWAQGHYSKAEPLFVEALEIRKTELGNRHPGTAASLNNLAGLYYSQGRYSEAEPLYLEALEIRKAELGDCHPNTASSLNNLAELYNSQGCYGEAEPLYLEALEIRKTELGDRHPYTASSLNNLALLYNLQGRYSEAEPLYVEALEVRKTELGDRHPYTAGSLFSLAALYHDTQRHQQALDHIQQALDIYIPVLGADHPITKAANSWLQTIQQAAD